MNNPLVSIIIPAYNRAHLIGETLESLSSQTYNNWECIVVDDGSTDDTPTLLAAYCEKDSRFQYHHRPTNRPKGANACRNYGFQLSKGDYIMFVDSDDLITKDCIENRINVFLNFINIDFIIADTAILGIDTNQQHKINRDPKYFTNENCLVLFLSYQIPWTIMSAFWKRKIIQEFSFDEALSRFQDVDFHISILLSNKFFFKRIHSIDNYYRNSSEDKILNNNYTKAVVSSFFKIIDKYENIINDNKAYRCAFKRFFYIISRDFIFFNHLTEKKNVEILFAKIKVSKLMDFKEKLIFRVFWFYCIFGIINRKGFGVHRFRKFSNDYFNNCILNK